MTIEMSDRLDKAVRSLGRYFNVTDRSHFVSTVLAGDDFDPNVSSITPIQHLANLLVKLTGNGLTAHAFIDKLIETYNGASKEDKDLAVEALLIVYDGADSNGDDFASAGLPIAPETISQVLSSPKGINEEVGNSKSSALSCFMIKKAELGFTNRETGAVSLFMNSIPSIEMSRCVPVINVMLISPDSPISTDGRIEGLSLGQFLMGHQQLAEDSADYAIVDSMAAPEVPPDPAGGFGGGFSPTPSAVGMELFTSPQTMVPADENYDDYAAFQEIQKFDDAGDPVENATVHTGGLRASGIIDKFRPFMSLLSLNVSIVPTSGFYSYKSAQMSMMLHDRSRLSEIASFVKADLYGSTEIVLEYGWSHPDGGPASENDYGVLLDSLRVQEKYGIVNSNFSFTDGGQVSIDVTLAMKGGPALNTTYIGEDPEVTDELKEVKMLVEAIAAYRSQVAGSVGAGNVTGTTVLSSVSDTARAVSLTPEAKTEIRQFIKTVSTLGKGKASGDLKELAANLTKLVGKKKGDGQAQKLTNTIAHVVGNRVAKLREGPDPWMPTVAMGAFGTIAPGTKQGNKRQAKTKYVSLAKLLLSFCGEPLAQSEKFTEVQFIFYPFNSKASFMHGLSVANFPINISRFETEFKERTKTSSNLPLRAFLSFVSNSFIVDQTSDAWGLTNLYGSANKEGNRELKKAYEDSTQLNAQKQLRLEAAYGKGASLQFKMPRVQMYIEAVPGQDVEGPKGTITLLRIHVFDQAASSYDTLGDLLEAARNKEIGAINVQASKSAAIAKSGKEGVLYGGTPHYPQMAAFFISKALDNDLIDTFPADLAGQIADGSLTADDLKGEKAMVRLKGGFPALKNFVANTMPSIIYGSQNSAIIDAKLGSINNPALATVNMLRAGQTSGVTAQGARDAGLPLQISPVSLSLTTFGCPVMSFGQEFFIDFGTGTNIDNIYVVTGVDHRLGPGEFTTEINLVNRQAFGKYTSLIDNVKNALIAVAEIDGSAK